MNKEEVMKLANEANKDIGYTFKLEDAKQLHELMEKFAELIVRECATVCRDQPNVYAMKLDRDNCAIAIEEHFGVEE